MHMFAKIQQSGKQAHAVFVRDFHTVSMGIDGICRQKTLSFSVCGSKYFAHTLNNTVVAPPRMLIAFLENHYQPDGTVTIPEVLWPYMGGQKVLTPKK